MSVEINWKLVTRAPKWSVSQWCVCFWLLHLSAYMYLCERMWNNKQWLAFEITHLNELTSRIRIRAVKSGTTKKWSIFSSFRKNHGKIVFFCRKNHLDCACVCCVNWVGTKSDKFSSKTRHEMCSVRWPSCVRSFSCSRDFLTIFHWSRCHIIWMGVERAFV